MADQFEQPVLTMSAMGHLGKFGNQVFEYSFLRIAARASGARVECNPWPGNQLFGHDDPPVTTTSLPPLIQASSRTNSMFDILPDLKSYIEKISGMPALSVDSKALSEGTVSGNLWGVFLVPTSHLRPHREFLRSLFSPLDDLNPWLDEPVTLLRERGRTIVTIHLRRGDYKWLPQLAYTMSVPPRWWVEWLDENWDSLDNPVLYICSNDLANLKREFAKYNPLTASDLHLGPPERVKGIDVDFYRDFHVMRQSDVLGIGNSSFSFAAALLNDHATTFVRPVWDLEKRFERFDPWDADPLLYMQGGPRPYLKGFKGALRVAHATGGVKEVLATALVYYPAGMRTLRKLGKQYSGK